jgi:hypothetical protein
MCTVLGIAAVFSALRPRSAESTKSEARDVASAVESTTVAVREAPSAPPTMTVGAEPQDAQVFEDLGRAPLVVDAPRRQRVTRPNEIPSSKSGEIPRVSRQGGVVVVNPWAKP